MTRLHAALPRLCFPFYLLLALFTLTAEASDEYYDLHYHVNLADSEEFAHVTISIPDASLIKEMDFNLDKDFHQNIEANGKLSVEDGRALWQPPEKDARFSLDVTIAHKRDDGGYDALREKDFAIFRGDDLVPPASVVTLKGAQSKARLTFTLPDDWRTANSGWHKNEDSSFTVDDPERRFDRPTGWMIAGKLGTRRERLPDTHIAVSAPLGNAVKRLDVLSFILLNWPTIREVVGETPEKILIVGAGDPMWRGGLSGPNSLFVHADRPMVSENGTSTLLHELFHTITGITDEGEDDWITEGLAEYYSYAILHRAGGLTDERRQLVVDWLTDWSKDVKSLRGKSSSGERTARAALLFDELDDEIKAATENRKSLDDATRAMMKEKRVNLEELTDIVEALIGRAPKTLDTPLLR
ncbi:hypothetical protein [Gilvimarinus algae]|uniref:Peptidase M61 catalytic domain-containing protein n=1 Tax=Gilvimarinus algae TaxID=3058037 RepID=A0ABT8TES6_9GAMM|nr:hypothetical protein [Gilvimarinus sp. SDUM040014]MDO3382135.1 hypothetical protein [Gilvimarinus sp. SDUM040014]